MARIGGQPETKASVHGSAHGSAASRQIRTASWRRTALPDDIDVIFEKDPAARNVLEVLTYQGLHAILLHRLAHALYVRRVPFLPRLISQFARFITAGIEIHPGA